MHVPTIQSIAEVVLSVKDLPRMRSFYCDVMGFEVFLEGSHPAENSSDSKEEPTISFLKILELDSPLGRQSHPQVLVLIDYKRHASGRPGHNVTTSTLHHLAFEIPREAYEEHLEFVRGHQLNPREVDFPSISAKSIFFEDPEGNSLEFICPSGEGPASAGPQP